MSTSSVLALLFVVLALDCEALVVVGFLALVVDEIEVDLFSFEVVFFVVVIFIALFY